MGHIVLLGDSIFDNARYVPDRPPVIEQLRRSLPPGWRASLLAADGAALAALTCPYIMPLNRPKAPDIPRTIALLQETAAALSLRVRGQIDAEPQAEDA